MEEFKISQLVKEMVAVRLRKIDDPCQAAAEVVGKTLLVTLKSFQAPEIRTRIVADSCYGGLIALVIAGHDLPKGAALFVAEASVAAEQLGLDSVAAMRDAMLGIASAQKILMPEQIGDIRDELERRYHGAGAAFEEYIKADKAADALGAGTRTLSA